MGRITCKRTGAADLEFDGTVLAMASLDRGGALPGRLCLFRTTTGKFVLAATIGRGQGRRDLVLTFSRLSDFYEFLADSNNFFNPLLEEMRLQTCDAESVLYDLAAGA